MANHLLKDVSEEDLTKTCYQLIINTNYFDIYVENNEKEIEETDFAIQMISEYLKGVAGKDGITGKQFRKKFKEIQAQLYEDISGTVQNAENARQNESPFNFGTLFLSCYILT